MNTGVSEIGLRNFNLQVKLFGSTLMPGKLVEFHQKVCLQVLSGFIYETPVDTGRARGGWQLEIETVPQGNTDNLDRAGDGTFFQGLATLNGLRPYQLVWITNNVEYIIPLEEGHSQQKPKGWIAQTLERVRQQFA